MNNANTPETDEIIKMLMQENLMPEVIELDDYISNFPDIQSDIRPDIQFDISELNQENRNFQDLDNEANNAYNNLKLAIEQTLPNKFIPNMQSMIINAPILKNLKKCNNGYYRSRRTHRCRKSNKIQSLKRYKKRCKRGKERHYSGKCIKKCKSGKRRNGTKRCKKN